MQQYDDIAPFLPPQESRFKVLLTTRSHFGSPVHDLQLDVLAEAKALELLQSLVDRDRPDLRGFQNLGGLDTAKQLCEWLGYLPLGVELVGRYLARKPDLSLEVLWHRLQEKRLDAIAFKQAEPSMTASLGVTAAFELSWQTLDESAQQVAAVLSLFALVEIPWTLVEQCLPDFDAEELEELRDRQLLGTHLLKRVDQGMYQLHQLLREFFAAKRSQRADESVLQQTFYQVVIAEAERVVEKPERSLIQESTVMIAHLQAAIERLTRPDQALDLATCLNRIAVLYYKQGRYAEAELLLGRSLSMQQQQLGDDHLHVAKSLNDLANLYRVQERYSEAEPLYVRALSIQEQQLGDDHLDVAQSLNNLALVYNSQGHDVKAEPLHIRALSIREQQLGNDHSLVAASLNNLALVYNLQGRSAEAEPLHIRALSIREQQLGFNHPDVSISLNNLAYLYTDQGCYTKAEPLLVRALEILQQHLGSSHPLVAICLNNLARLYCLQACYSDAEPLFRQSLSILQNQLPGDKPFTARVLSNLAHLYDLQGHYREAESLYLQALPIFSTKLEANHPWMQEGSQNFRALLQKAIQEQRTDELSDDPMTRSMLWELREGSREEG